MRLTGIAAQPFGELRLTDALHRSCETSKEIAAFALVVEAKNERARSFYVRYEFQLFDDYPGRLFMPMTKSEKLVAD